MYTMVLCEQVGWFVGWGMNVSFVVVVGASASTEGFVWKLKIRFTSMHYIQSIRMFEDDVT
jgi:hypothetical protein